SSNGEVIARGGKDLPFALPSRLDAGRSGTASSPSGDEWIYSVAAVSSNNLYVVYAEPRSKILSAALAQFRASIVIPLVAILLTLAAIWVGTNRLAIRWLTALSRLSDDFTKGNFVGNRAAFASAPLELREVSDDLHDMAEVIETRTNELTDALAAKTELTREVHHRVKNNLQIVISLLTMQSARMNDDGAKIALKQTRARIQALALIHRLTYDQHNSGDEASVMAQPLLSQLCSQLGHAYRDRRRIEMSCIADDYAMSIDAALPFALFVVEAVTNSYRHAFADGKGRIEVSFVLDGLSACLSVKDDGIGYDTGPVGRAELGTELMQGFAGQLGGELTLASTPGAGSFAVLRFPAQRAVD
ncbi:MAG TPA: sensor histidine kinase, partial [Sphingorhabdus sp.]|nr:sensor histidine kinase [Sphingorhabdus sp.]